MKNVKLGVVLVLMLALCFSLVACGGQTATTPADNKDKKELTQLTMGAQFNPDDSLDPATATSPGSMMVTFSLYDGLVLMTDKGKVYSLAESITPQENGKTWVITLRDNVTFSNGEPVTGQDVVDSLKHISMSPQVSQIYAGVDFDSCTATDKEATITMKQPEADFELSALCMYSPIAPGGNFDGIGAGPYLYVSGDSSTGYQLKANPTYWKGEPKITDLTIKQIPDPAAQTNALAAGEIDFAWGLDGPSLQALKNKEDIVINASTLDSAISKELVLNTRVAPFNDPEVRQAAKLAIDRDKMVATLLGDSGEVANDMLGKDYPQYPTNIAQTKVDKEKAREIFARKGVTEFTILASDIVPGLEDSAQLMAQEFADVGVTVTVETLDPQSFFAQMQDVYQAPAFTFFWINRAPITMLNTMGGAQSPYNVSGYTTDSLTEQIERAKTHTDPKIQEEAVALASQEIHDKGGDLIWGFQKQQSAHKKGLEGIVSVQTVPFLADATFSEE